MEDAHLIVGLGNPGREYADTRHNAGFAVVERLADGWGWKWDLDSSFQARLARGTVADRRVLLCQPQTYMNLSGTAVGPLAKFYRIGPERLLVVVDDADLPLGTVRLRADGSSGGHHGLESVEQHLGTRKYARLRLGIGRRHPEDRRIAGHVLGRFTADEARLFGEVLAHAADAAKCWLLEGVGTAMNRFNGVVGTPAK
ncbi:MAG: aminoacyl-tRNA hydrolase [Verrucomicrobia bacterium]|jgi:PTH1 family peptidyl-tRNA hydrolase|nr:aminoacyl-tRNA hydrolase [Verrucomicrobiota bacterium]